MKSVRMAKLVERWLGFVVGLTLILPNTNPAFAQADEDELPADDTPVEETTLPETPVTDVSSGRFVITLNSNKTDLAVPADRADIDASSALLVAKVATPEGEPVSDATVTFASGNQYWPDNTGGFSEGAERVTNEDGEATITYVADGDEDLVDIYAYLVTNPNDPLENREIESASLQLVKDNPETVESPGENTNPVNEPTFETTLQGADADGKLKIGELQDKDKVLQSVLGSGIFKGDMAIEVSKSKMARGGEMYDVEVTTQGAYSEKEVRDKDNKLIAGRTGAAADMGNMDLVFEASASDGATGIADFTFAMPEPGTSLFQRSLSNLLSSTSRTEAGYKDPKTNEDKPEWKTIYVSRNGENKTRDTMSLNPDVPGERDITVKVSWVTTVSGACKEAKKEEESEDSASEEGETTKLMELNTNPFVNLTTWDGYGQRDSDCTYIVAQKEFSLRQENRMPSEAKLELSSSSTEVSGPGREVKISGQLSASIYEQDENGEFVPGEFNGSSGAARLSIVTSDGKNGFLEKDNITVGADGKFSMTYNTPEEEAPEGSRTITITADGSAIVKNDKGEERNLGDATGSVVITQTFDKKEDDDKADDSRLVLGSATDGNRTLTVYANRNTVAPTYSFKPRESKCFDALQTCREFGTKINDLANNKGVAGEDISKFKGTPGFEDPRYIVMTAEVTDNLGTPATGNVKTTLDTRANAGYKPMMAAPNVQGEYFYPFGLDSALDAQTGDANFYFAVRAQGTYTSGTASTPVSFNHSYTNKGRLSNIPVEVTIPLVTFQQGLSDDYNDPGINIDFEAPPRFNDEKTETPGGLPLQSYEEILARLRQGQLTEQEKLYVQEQVAWKIIVTIKPTDGSKPSGSVGLSSTPAGEFLAADTFKEKPIGDDITDPTQPWKPVPLNAILPGEFNGLQAALGNGSAPIDGNKATAYFIPQQSPHLVPSTIRAIYGDSKKSYQASKELFFPKAQVGSSDSEKVPDKNEIAAEDDYWTLKLSANPTTINLTDKSPSTRVKVDLDSCATCEASSLGGVVSGDQRIAVNVKMIQGSAKFSVPEPGTEVKESGDKFVTFDMQVTGDTGYITVTSNPKDTTSVAIIAQLNYRTGAIPHDLDTKPLIIKKSDGEELEEESNSREGTRANIEMDATPKHLGANDKSKVTFEVEMNSNPNNENKPYVAIKPIEVTFKIAENGKFEEGGTTIVKEISHTGGDVSLEVSPTASSGQIEVVADYKVIFSGAKPENNLEDSVSIKLAIDKPDTAEDDEEQEGDGDGDGDGDTGDGDGDGDGTGGFEFDPNKPLGSFNYSNELDQIGDSIEASQWLSDSEKQRIQDDIDAAKANPDATIYIRNNIGNAIAGGSTAGTAEQEELWDNVKNDPTAKDLADAAIDIYLARMRQQIRDHEGISDRQKKEFDQLAQYFQETRDPSVFDRMGELNYTSSVYATGLKSHYEYFYGPIGGANSQPDNDTNSNAGQGSGASVFQNFLSFFAGDPDTITGAHAGQDDAQPEGISIWQAFVNWLRGKLYGGD